MKEINYDREYRELEIWLKNDLVPADLKILIKWALETIDGLDQAYSDLQTYVSPSGHVID